MPASACCSAITSGVAIRSIDLHSNHAVLDDHGERVDGNVRRQVQGLPGAQVEERSMARALDRAVVLIELALHELAVVMRAAVLDREDRALAVEDADLEVVDLDHALLAGRQLLERADVEQGAHSNPIPEVRILSSGPGSLRLVRFETGIGVCGLRWSERGITAVLMPPRPAQ